MFKVDELIKATKARLASSKKDAIIKGISIDSRIIKPGEAFVAIKGNNFDGHDFIGEVINKGASCIIKEAAVKKDIGTNTVVIEVKDTIRALGDIAQYQRKKFDIPVIAVTGSNGKTTAKEMIARVLSGKFKVLKNFGTKNNHIGLPMALLGLDSSYDLAVLEVGTNHFGEIAYLAKICSPNIVVITNIGSSHLEFLNNLKGVFKEKYTLINKLKAPYLAILDSDDGLLKKEITKKIKKPFIISFGIKNKSDFIAQDIKASNGKIEFLVNRKYAFTLNTLGHYNIYNALAAITAGRIFGLDYGDIARRLSDFDFPQSRLKLAEFNNIRFIDDTYNSNPLSLRQALEALERFKTKGRKIFIMGDMLELGSRKDIFHYEAGRKIAGICDVFITVGELSCLSAKGARDSGFTKDSFHCKSASEARDILLKKISPTPEDIVLVKGSRSMKMEEVFKI